ncbi:MAG: ribonuclease domain-containing protein [Anaerobutyricum sp.]|nr:ribonuclease domain-containing protein [Anaerobutyricum sp.]
MQLKKKLRSVLPALLSFFLLLVPLVGCENASFNEATTEHYAQSSNVQTNEASTSSRDETAAFLSEDGTYTSKDDVMEYLIQYGKLPQNFITKKEAKKLGWNGGALEPYAPGKCIGGDYFGNYEGTLPEVSGRTYHECDIDTLGKDNRGAKRIVFSDDGQIYYTNDHYKTFTLLYGEGE